MLSPVRFVMSCRLYGSCGQTSIFTPDLPCVGEFEPKKLSKQAHKKLESLCGPMPQLTCCSLQQVETLQTSLKRAEALVGACPACHKNFVDLWCQFTCSPDQSFLQVTKNQTSMAGHEVPKQVEFSVESEFASGLYDSCKDVTFGATNGKAMDLIGGGATDYHQFLKFLGDEKPMLGGSAFQINFNENEPALSLDAKLCSDKDWKCACVDCPQNCPQLEPLDPPQSCRILGVNCMSVGLLSVYAVCLLVMVVMWYKTRTSRHSSLAILEDDEDQAVTDPLMPSRSFKSLQPYRINTILQSAFERLGYFCAQFPLLVITLCALFVLVSSIGLLGIELLDDPNELWVGPNSLEAQERATFDREFGMFYRTEQLFLVNETGPILQDFDTVEWLFNIEDRVEDLRCNLTQDNLYDFCFKPLSDDANEDEKSGCAVESITSYFGTIDRINPSNWKQRLGQCFKSPVMCLPSFQQPISPQLVLGTFDEDPFETRALVTTWILNNSDDPTYLGRVERWEYEIELLFQQIAREAELRGLRASFNLESSLARELTKSSSADVKVIILSYVLMFVYASFSLGGRIRQSDPLIKSKFSLGLEGIVMVLLSVISSIGICSSAGVKLTLIITEVIPFLVLAVGVDNIFLLVHDLELVNDLYPQYTIEEQVSKAVGLIGPSIFLSSTCEIVAILIGVNVSMPAVHNFAVYSGVAVLINSVLQLTMFVSVMTLDQYRIKARRVDCAPCFVLPEETIDPDETMDLGFIESQEDNRNFGAFIRHYSPYLFKRWVKLSVVCVFTCWLAVSLSLIPQMEMGLDQRFAVPSNSFLVSYFTDMSEYFQVGPPVYFVVDGAQPQLRADQQQLCGRFGACDEFSIPNIIEQERKRPQVSYLSAPAASWIDDYFQWLNPDLDCCFETTDGDLCFEEGPKCTKCWADRKYDGGTMQGFPTNTTFEHYLDMWLEAPSDECPLGGKAPYGTAISRNGSHVQSFHYRSQHVPLRNQSDYINAYAAARRIASFLSEATGFSVFPYSVFYVYFAQYRTLVSDTLRTLGAATLVVFLLSSVILGSIRTAGVVTAVVMIMVCNVCGLMKLWGVSLNALSLVNLLICVGIGVEFCIHIARAFTFVHKVNSLALQGFSKTERACNALAGTGGTVFGGIAITKLIGVAVLGFAKSKIFEVYYFRMWLALVFCATLHSLVLLPVLLSCAGGSAYIISDTGLVDQFRNLSL